MKRILVVDDEPDICSNLADILLDFGYRVDTCTSPEEAVKRVEAVPYEMALIDFRMPTMDGVELYRLIKKARPSTEALLVTAFAEQETEAQAKSVGFRLIIPKPVDIPHLLDAIGPTNS